MRPLIIEGAKVCVCVGTGDAALIGKTITSQNVDLPNNEKGNLVVLHGTVPVE